MKKRLWDKGQEVNERIHRFTVGTDPVTDVRLARFDAIGSAAHARMLSEIGVLTKEETKELCVALKEILEIADRGEFRIPVELEDCHSTIENMLVEKLGESGKKIHTGRSRNDQVLVTTRLYLRSELVTLLEEVSLCGKASLKRYPELKSVPLPGYTHLQRAMPSSVGMWLLAFAESFVELLRDGLLVFSSIDANPLGVASGFGVPLELKRERTTELLGFSRTQRNPIAVQNSRGVYEGKVSDWCDRVASVIEKLAWDMSLFVTSEFGFFSLPNEFTTGSSIMPQKRNPDVLELLRGSAAKVRACGVEMEGVIEKLPSNYHRDFQLTKEPLVRLFDTIGEIVPITAQVIETFSVNRAAIEAAMSNDLYATYDTYKLVREGLSFREAYKKSAERNAAGVVERKDFEKDYAIIEAMLEGEYVACKDELALLEKSASALKSKIEGVEKSVWGI